MLAVISRLLIALSLLVAVAVAALLALSAIAVWSPEWLIGPRTSDWLKVFLAERGVTANWKELRLTSHGFLTPRYTIDVKDFCFKTEGGNSVCGQSFNAGVEISLLNLSIRTIDLPIASNLVVIVHTSPSASKPASGPDTSLIERLATYIPRIGRPLSLTNFRVRVEGPGLLLVSTGKRIEAHVNEQAIVIEGDEICANLVSGTKVETCVTTFAADIGYRIANAALTLTQVRKLRLESPRLGIHLSSDSPQSEVGPQRPPAETSSSPPSPADLVTLTASLLKRYDIKEVEVNVAEFTLTRGKNLRIQSRLSLQSLQGDPLRLQARAEATTIATATDHLKFRELQVTLQSSTERPNELSLEARVDASARSGFAITVAIRGTATRSHLRILLDARADGLPLTRISSCSIAATLPNTAGTWSVDYKKCGLRLRIPPIETKGIAVDVPAFVEANLEGAFQMTTAQDFSSTTHLQWQEITTNILRFRGNASLRVEGNTSTPLQGWSIRPRINTTLQISNFATLVETLRRTPYAIPAPFAALTGPISLAVDSEILHEPPLAFAVPFTLSTRLESPRQTVFTRIQTRLRLDLGAPKPNLTIATQIELSDVELMLPRIHLTSIPRVRRDSRVHHSEATLPDDTLTARGETQPVRLGVPQNDLPFTLNWRVEVKTVKPIRLHSNLATKPIPIALQLNASGDTPVDGKVRVESFPIEIFRRTAQVEAIILTLAPDGSQNISGRVTVDYGTMLIRILLSGSLDKPIIEFDSTPERSRRDILLALMFGREIDEMSPTQLTSVDNMEAAVANGALTLASLYFLASTPIQSVGYNPNTNYLSVQVRLPDGTVVEVGRSDDVQRIGAGKRLFENIYLRTFLERETTTEDLTISTMLEWAISYW